jgi:hypothetical protein
MCLHIIKYCLERIKLCEFGLFTLRLPSVSSGIESLRTSFVMTKETFIIDIGVFEK